MGDPGGRGGRGGVVGEGRGAVDVETFALVIGGSVLSERNCNKQVSMCRKKKKFSKKVDKREKRVLLRVFFFRTFP